MGPLELLRPLCQPACVFDEPGHEPIQQDGEPHAAPPPTHHCQRSAPFAQAACRQVAASVASVAWLNLRHTSAEGRKCTTGSRPKPTSKYSTHDKSQLIRATSNCQLTRSPAGRRAKWENWLHCKYCRIDRAGSANRDSHRQPRAHPVQSPVRQMQ